MRVRVTESFPWAPDGIRVITAEAGTVVEGRAAEIAIEQKRGQLLDEDSAAAAPAAGDPTPAELEPAAAVLPDAAPTPPQAPDSSKRRAKGR